MAVYVFCCNAQSEPHSDPRDVLRYLYSINCPTVICLPSMFYLSYGETPLVNCGPWSNFLYIVTLFYFTCTVYFSWITIILLPLDTLNPLFTANRWDWQPYRKLGAKYLFVLYAGFTLLLGEDMPTSSWSGALVRIVTKLASITFLSLVLSPTGSIQPWFHKWGKTCCCAHHTFSWGSQLVGYLHQHRTINKFSSAVAGEKEGFCKGSLARTIFYFFLVLLHFMFACIVLSKIQKN
jgi:hypothetical protein